MSEFSAILFELMIRFELYTWFDDLMTLLFGAILVSDD
jgi:hypothetical protein